MTRDLEPGMVIHHSTGYWIVFAVTDGSIIDWEGKMRPQSHRLHDGSVALLCFDYLDGDDEPSISVGWEVRRNSAVFSDHNEYKVIE